MLAVMDEFGNTRNIGRDHGPAQGHGFHDHDRKPLGEAWQHERSCLKNVSAYLIIADPAGDADLRPQCVLLDQRFDVGPQFTIAGKRKRKINPGFSKMASRFNQEKLSLLFAKSADADQVFRVGIGRCAVEEGRLESAVHDVKSCPIADARPGGTAGCGQTSLRR